MAVAAEDLVSRSPQGRDGSCGHGRPGGAGERHAERLRGGVHPHRDRQALRLVGLDDSRVGGPSHVAAAAQRRRHRRREMVHRRRRTALVAVAMVAGLVTGVAAAGVAGTDTAGVDDVRNTSRRVTAGQLVSGAEHGRPALVTVPAGGSVWSSVVPFAPDGMSPHDWVAQVVDLNGIDASAVQPGTPLRLPQGP